MQDGCCPLLAIDTLSIAPFRLFFYLITAAFLFACLCFCQTLSLSVKYNCRRRRTVLMSPIATRPTHKINNYFVHFNHSSLSLSPSLTAYLFFLPSLSLWSRYYSRRRLTPKNTAKNRSQWLSLKCTHAYETESRFCHSTNIHIPRVT